MNFCNANIMGQNNIDSQIKQLKKKHSVPKLSKAKMYADFDTLISIMKRCNPQYLIRKSATCYDMIAEMKAQRSNIKKCNNMSKFINFINNTLFLSLDEHCGFEHNVWYFSNSIYKNDVKINNITDKEFGINFHYKDMIFDQDISELYFIYAPQGNYLLKNKTIFYNKSDSLELPIGTEIFSFNNQPLSIYLNSIRTSGSGWDYENKVYYNTFLEVANNKNCIGYYKNNEYKEFQFTYLIQEEMEDYYEFLLHWFDKDSILYFRVPQMRKIDIQRYEKFIKQFPDANISIPEWELHFEENVLNFATKPVKSVIMDIRGNPGGNDLAWKEQLLGLIIKNPIEYPFCLAGCNDNDVFLRYFPETDKNVTFDFIDSSYQFRIFQEEIDTIKPYINNIGYDGTIYLLVNEDCYSSALGFASLNAKTEKIKTIGMPTGKIGGQGATPSVFVLPFSKFMFSLELFLDASCVSKVEDFYHDQVNYRVTPSIEYYKYWYDPARPYRIDEETMYERDEVFLKALEIIRSQKE